MPEEGFLRRWARVKATGADEVAEAPPPAPARPASALAPAPATAPATTRWARAGDALPASPPAPASVPGHDPAGDRATGAPAAADGRPAPTLEDVAQLTPDSDYSIFVGQGVDKSVQRLALKKLFADPHFNVMDRLDMYMDDYNIPSPVSAEMLASLDHARSSLRRFIEDDPALAEAPPEGVAPLPVEGEGEGAGEAEAQELAESPAPQSASPADSPDEAVLHNEATHAAAAHEEPLPGPSPCLACPHDEGPFHRPIPQLHQGQA